MLYGTTSSGGSSNKGTIFALGTNGAGFTIIKHFGGGNDGDTPAGLVISGTTLYGTTCFGGTSNYGTVFKIGTDGSGYAVLKDFAGYPGDGAEPRGGLLLSGATLYGTTMYHGSYVYGGTVFKINTDGTGYTVLKNFVGPEGAHPNGGMALLGSTLYGTTGGGGTSEHGTVFKVNTDGSGFVMLKSFTWTNADGYWPESGLVCSGSTLYGTTLWSQGAGLGTVYEITADGGDCTVLKEFVGGAEGRNLNQGLLVCGNALYGGAYWGGSSDRGTLFQVNTDGSGFTVLKDFLGSDGAHLNAPLVFSDGTLYGMTEFGGRDDGGVVFSLSLPPPSILTPPQTQTAEAGATACLSVEAAGAPVLSYQWFLNVAQAIGVSSTNSVLDLTNVQSLDSGSYTVVITNVSGSLTSAPAMLNVIPPVERRIVPAVKLFGTPGSLLHLESVGSLDPPHNWQPLADVSLTGASEYYFELAQPLPPQRFMRIRQTAPTDSVPYSQITLVPAITLTGDTGSKVQVDAINCIGPTDAWFTLDTVTLTNTSQLYFDVSAPGQPIRLYRLVPVP